MPHELHYGDTVAELYRENPPGNIQRVRLVFDFLEPDGVFKLFPPLSEPRSGNLTPDNTAIQEVPVSQVVETVVFDFNEQTAPFLTNLYKARYIRLYSSTP